MPRHIATISTELTIEKAMEFVGDNSNYQKRRLFIIGLTVFALAVLTSEISLEVQTLSIFFLIASGAGQIICPIYMSLRTCTLGVAASALLASGLYPFGGFLRAVVLLAMGFFSRGFFVSSLIYLNQIGGDKFRAWAMLVIFALWALSSVISSIEEKLAIGRWLGYYLFVFVPCLLGSYLVLQNWQPSPLYLYYKKQYSQAKAVLEDMARQNERPSLPYGLEGDDSQQTGYRRVTYLQLVTRRFLRKITIPLCVMWVYREYVYYTSYMMIPQISSDYGKIYIMVAISETVAVLLSYPIRIHIKRVNAAAASVLAVLLMSLPSSFTTVPEECLNENASCPTKTLYYFSLMMTRFSMSLLGIVLVSYTLQIYPSNVRRLGFSVCLGVSSIGSILMPWINQIFLELDLSGFITFALTSIAALAFIPKLEETFGRMKTETLEELQNSPGASLRSWALLNFNDQ